MQMQSLSMQHGNEIQFSVDLRRKELVISFTMAMPDVEDEDLTSSAESSSTSSQDSDTMQQCLYKFAIPFQQINEIWKHVSVPSGIDIFIPLTIPPRFYRKRIEMEQTHQKNSKQWHFDSDAFYRQTSITRNRHILKHAPFSLRGQAPEIDTGKSMCPEILLKALLSLAVRALVDVQTEARWGQCQDPAMAADGRRDVPFQCWLLAVSSTDRTRISQRNRILGIHRSSSKPLCG